MKNVNRFSYHRFSLYFRLEISDLSLAAFYTHSYVPYAHRHTHTKSAAKLQKIFEFCKYFDKKISEKCNIDHKRAIFTPCNDHIWAIYHNKKGSLTRVFSCTPSRGRTGTDCSTGVWDQRVYRFRHLGSRVRQICWDKKGDCLQSRERGISA